MQTNSCCSLFVARLLAEPYYVLVIEVPMFAPLPAQKGSSISVTSMKWASAGEDKRGAGQGLCLRAGTWRGGGALPTKPDIWGESPEKIKRGSARAGRAGASGGSSRRGRPRSSVGASPCGPAPRASPRRPRTLRARRPFGGTARPRSSAPASGHAPTAPPGPAEPRRRQPGPAAPLRERVSAPEQPAGRPPEPPGAVPALRAAAERGSPRAKGPAGRLRAPTAAASRAEP